MQLRSNKQFLWRKHTAQHTPLAPCLNLSRRRHSPVSVSRVARRNTKRRQEHLLPAQAETHRVVGCVKHVKVCDGPRHIYVPRKFEGCCSLSTRSVDGHSDLRIRWANCTPLHQLYAALPRELLDPLHGNWKVCARDTTLPSVWLHM